MNIPAYSSSLRSSIFSNKSDIRQYLEIHKGIEGSQEIEEIEKLAFSGDN